MLVIQRMKQEDLRQVLDIEQTCFKAPWTEEQFLYEVNDNPFCTILLIKDDDLICGYLDFWTTFETATICKIAVRPEYRRNRYAFKLMEEAFELMKQQEVETVTLEVRVSNEGAIRFYESIGFIKVTIKPHYYDDGEDAYYMVKGGTDIWDKK